MFSTVVGEVLEASEKNSRVRVRFPPADDPTRPMWSPFEGSWENGTLALVNAVPALVPAPVGPWLAEGYVDQ